MITNFMIAGSTRFLYTQLASSQPSRFAWVHQSTYCHFRSIGLAFPWSNFKSEKPKKDYLNLLENLFMELDIKGKNVKDELSLHSTIGICNYITRATAIII